MRQADRLDRAAHLLEHIPPFLDREAGGGDVGRLLEEGSFKRVRLVEDREELQLSVRHHAFDGDLAAWNVLLDRHRVVGRILEHPNVRRREQPAQPLGRGNKLDRGVGADDAPAAGQAERLDDARIGDPFQQHTVVAIHGNRPEPRRAQPGRPQPHAGLQLVPGDADGGRWMRGQSQHARREGADQRRPVADRQYRVEGRRRGRIGNRPHRRVLVVEPDRHRTVPPGVVQPVTPVGGQNQLGAEALGGHTERPDLVPGGGGDQQHARRTGSQAHRRKRGSTIAVSTDRPSVAEFVRAI